MSKVLIVDDERMIREGLKASIDWRMYGFTEVLLAKDGLEGKDMIIAYTPQLVITDIKMPRMNGIEMMDTTTDIPYEKIILSSYDDFEYAKAGIKHKVIDYLLKPIDEDQLKTLLQQVFKSIQQTPQTDALPEVFKPVLKSDYQQYYIQEAVDYIKQHMHSTIEIEHIATQLDISPSYLMRTFKQHTGITMKDFINRLRIYQSLKLLKQHLKVYEVAETVGYNEYKTFVYNFHKYMDQTPIEYMNNIKKR